MAEDNEAIQIDKDDDVANDQVYQSTIEDNQHLSRPLSVRSSFQQLIPPDAPRSIHSSVHSSLKSSKLICVWIVAYLKAFVLNTKLLWITIVFSVIGGVCFMWLETGADLKAKERSLEQHLMAREMLLFNIEMIHNSSSYQKRNEWKLSIIHFEEQIGKKPPKVETDWTFWQSVLYAGTISTTIGYGNIGCKTVAGRTVSMFYAILGIPLMIVILDKLGVLLLGILKQLSYVVDDFCFFLAIRLRLKSVFSLQTQLRYKTISKRYARLGLFAYRPIYLSKTSFEKASLVEKAKLPSKPRLSRASETIHSTSVIKHVNETTPEFNVEATKDSEKKPIGEAKGKKTSRSDRSENCGESKESSQTVLSVKTAAMDETEESVETDIEEQLVDKADVGTGTCAIQKTQEKEKVEEEERDPPVVAAIVTTIGCIALSAAVFCLWEEWDYFTSFYFFFISLSTIGFGDVIPAHPKYMVAMFSLLLIGLALVTVCINVIQEKISLMYKRILLKMLEQFLRAQEEGDPEALKGFVEGFNSQAKFLMPLISKNESAKVMKRFKAEARARGIELPAALTDMDPKTGKPAFCSVEAAENVDAFVEQKKQEAQAVINTPVYQQNSCATQTLLSHGHKHRRLQTEPPTWCMESYSFGVQMGAQLRDTGAQTDTESVDSGIQCNPELRSHDTQFDSTIYACDQSTMMDIEYKTTGVQPEVSFIMQLVDDDADKSSLDEDFSDYVGESSDVEDQEVRSRACLKQEKLQTRSSTEKHGKSLAIRYMRDQHSQVVASFSNLPEIQTQVETRNQGLQAGPSTFVDFKDIGCWSFLRQVDSEVQVESRIKHMTTQTKTKFKEIGIQNKIMQSMQSESETQVRLQQQEVDTQTDVGMADESSQIEINTQVHESQTNMVEFLKLKAIVEAETQTLIRLQSRKAQTHLSSTMKDFKAYRDQQEDLLQLTKVSFEQKCEEHQKLARGHKKEIDINKDEVEVLKPKLFNLRLDRARELKMENELIRFDTNEEIEKLQVILKKLRSSGKLVDAKALTSMLREHNFPIERIENDFDFDVLLRFLREESEVENVDEDEEITMFTEVRETQTEISAFQRAHVGVETIHDIGVKHVQTDLVMLAGVEVSLMAQPTTATVELQTQVLVEEKSVMTDTNSLHQLIQTEQSRSKEREQETQATTQQQEQAVQAVIQMADMPCDPILEVLLANLPQVWSTDTQTLQPDLRNSSTQSTLKQFSNSATQAEPDSESKSVSAIAECNNMSTDYQSITSDVQCQWELSLRDANTGEALEVNEIGVQWKHDTRDVGIQPKVSAFKLNSDVDNQVSPDLIFMRDTEVQYQELRQFADTGSDPTVSMFRQTEENLEEMITVLYMKDAGMQYEDLKIYCDVATAPKVSMFKLKSVDEDERKTAEDLKKANKDVKTVEADVKVDKDIDKMRNDNVEDGGDFFLNDMAVQHDRLMENACDVGTQPRVSMFKQEDMLGTLSEELVHFMIESAAQHDLEMTDQEVGEHLELIDAGIQPATSIFHRCDPSLEPADVNFLADSSTQYYLVCNSSSTQTQIHAETVECQTEQSVQSAQIQTDARQMTESGIQSGLWETSDAESQVERTTRTLVTQTQTTTAEVGVGMHLGTSEQGTQPKFSMFKLEDLQSKDDSMLLTELEFMTDTGTAPDYTHGKVGVGIQTDAEVVDAEVQTFYTGTIFDNPLLVLELRAQEEDEKVDYLVETSMHEHAEYLIRSLRRSRKQEVRHKRSRQTQVMVEEIAAKAEKQCQYAVPQTIFASQTDSSLVNWWSQTSSSRSMDQKVQTDKLDQGDKQVQVEPIREHKSAQTVQPVLGEHVKLFVELHAESDQERANLTSKVMARESAEIRIRKSRRKKKKLIKEEAETQTERQETASQLMQAELICQPEEESTERVLTCGAYETTVYLITMVKQIQGHSQVQRARRAQQFDKGMQTEGWTSRLIGQRQARVKKEERATQTNINLDILKSIRGEPTIEEIKRTKFSERSSQMLSIDQTTQTNKQVEPARKVPARPVESGKKVVKKVLETRNASSQTAITTTVPTPALRRMSRHFPLLIAREEATQTFDKLQFSCDFTCQTDPKHLRS